jgi:hypothetical protein
VIPALAFSIAISAACGGSGTDSGDALDAYVEAYNARDLSGVVAVFAEDAVVTGHPLAGSDSVTTGWDEIRDLEEQDMVLSAVADAYEMTNVKTSDNRVSFDHIIRHKNGNCFSGTGHTLIVEDGKIVRWEWGAPQPCP